MSGDELQVTFPSRPNPDDEFVGNMDATVELLAARYEARRQEEMPWRLTRVIESAYRAGVKAVAQSDIGWTPTCDKCGEEIKILGVTKYECANGCHKGKKHLGY
jgi:hypothetical protein